MLRARAHPHIPHWTPRPHHHSGCFVRRGATVTPYGLRSTTRPSLPRSSLFNFASCPLHLHLHLHLHLLFLIFSSLGLLCIASWALASKDSSDFLSFLSLLSQLLSLNGARYLNLFLLSSSLSSLPPPTPLLRTPSPVPPQSPQSFSPIPLDSPLSSPSPSLYPSSSPSWSISWSISSLHLLSIAILLFPQPRPRSSLPPFCHPSNSCLIFYLALRLAGLALNLDSDLSDISYLKAISISLNIT